MIKINEENTQIQYGYSKKVINILKQLKPEVRIQSDEIEQILQIRGLSIENTCKLAAITDNKTIMNYARRYVQEKDLNFDVIPPINHIRLYKKMYLLHKLIGFRGECKMKEMREVLEESSIK